MMFIFLTFLGVLLFSPLSGIHGVAFAAQEILSPPVISVTPDIYYPLEETLYLEGRADPHATLQIHFQKAGAKPVNLTVKSDANGEWVLAQKLLLEAGEWEVRVRTVTSSGMNSEWSNPRVFKAVATGITIGGVNIRFAFLSFFIVVLLITGIAVVAYFSWRVRRLKGVLVAKEIREVRDSVRGGISEIRKDLLEELRLLESSQRPISGEALARKEHLLRELENLEKTIEGEISDIEGKI